MKVGRATTLCLLMAALAVAEAGSQDNRVLMVGNSLTYFNKGLGYVLSQLAQCSHPPIEIETTLFTLPILSLGDLWNRIGRRQQQIVAGEFSTIILQDYLFEPGAPHGETEVQFKEYVGKFDQIAKKGGARTILFMQWHVQEDKALSLEEIVRAHENVAQELGVQIAPVGLAWAESTKANPDLSLFFDTTHPSPYGSYLAACVLYATLFGVSPEGLAYSGDDILLPGSKKMSSEDLMRLQAVAWRIVSGYPLARQRNTVGNQESTVRLAKR